MTALTGRPQTVSAAISLALMTLPAVPRSAAAAPALSVVQPGRAYEAAGGRCTFGFLLRGSDNRNYAATAGHCLPTPTLTTWPHGRGPVVRVLGQQVGEFAYAVSSSIDNDFALIRLAPKTVTLATVCAWGGPVAVAPPVQQAPQPFFHYGQGELPRQVSPARTGTTQPTAGGNYQSALGIVDAGDSGSPALDNQGRAIGVITVIAIGAGAGDIGINRLGPGLHAAERALHTRFTLQASTPFHPTRPSDDCGSPSTPV
jgi:hypothetical protein